MASLKIKRMFMETVGHGRSGYLLLPKPKPHCSTYGRWVWVVLGAGKKPDIFRKWNIALIHALYVAKSPKVMADQ